MAAPMMERMRFYPHPPVQADLFDSTTRHLLDDAAKRVSSVAEVPVLHCGGYRDHGLPATRRMCNEAITDG